MSKKKAENFSEIESALSRLGRPRPSRALREETLSRLGIQPKASFALAPALAWGACLSALLLSMQAGRQEPMIAAEAAKAPVQAASLPTAPVKKAAPIQAMERQAPGAVEPDQAAAPSSKVAQAPQPAQAPAPQASSPALPAPMAAPLNAPVEVPHFASQGGQAGSSSAPATAAKAGLSKSSPKAAPSPAYSFKIRSNRFRPDLGESLKVQVSLESPGQASLDIFDSRGQHVAQAFLGSLPQGESTLKWDGSNAPSGAYTLVFKSGQHIERFAAVLIR